MADKRFDIESDLKKLNLALNIPSFLGTDAQFDKSDVIKTQTIARHCIHVERGIGKVKQFKSFPVHFLWQCLVVPISCGVFAAL